MFPVRSVRTLFSSPARFSTIAPSKGAGARSDAAPPDVPARPPKQKFALLTGYAGCAFHGSQINPTHPTVEGALLRGLHASGLLDPRTDTLAKAGWSRASRTDRGVHAVGNVFSLKLRLPRGELLRNGHAPAPLTRLNAALPAGLRGLALVRTPGSFSAYTDAASRVYHYFLPLEAVAGGRPPGGDPTVYSPHEAAVVSKLNTLLSSFVGTHHFHNFTSPKLRSEGVHPVDAPALNAVVKGTLGEPAEVPGSSHSDAEFDSLCRGLYATGQLSPVGEHAAWLYAASVSRTVYSFAASTAPVLVAADAVVQGAPLDWRPPEAGFAVGGVWDGRMVAPRPRRPPPPPPAQSPAACCG